MNKFDEWEAYKKVDTLKKQTMTKTWQKNLTL